MKKILGSLSVLLVLVVSCAGCGGNYMKKIPMNEFDLFEYHRGGNITSLHIVARGAKKTDKTFKIDSININADYGPFVNFDIRVENYKRKIERND